MMAGVNMNTPPKHIKKIPVEVSWTGLTEGDNGDTLFDLISTHPLRNTVQSLYKTPCYNTDLKIA